MNEFTGVAIGVALLYPTMVALTSGEALGSIDLGVAGTFSWYATALGVPIIMPVSGRELGDSRPSHGLVRLYH